MATITRNNAWNSGGTFDNTDLLWYARAVAVMQSKPIEDPTSWWFYAAIHGEFLLQPLGDPYKYLNWVNIAYIPASANLNAPPSTKVTDLFWDQCQHGTWYFPPWHRGYLVAIENILRGIIVNQLNGPSSWALPYWNYLNQSKTNPEYNIPPAFKAAKLPDGTANPLYVPERYGPKGDGLNIFVPVGQNSANDECQWDTIFSEPDPVPPPGKDNLYGYFYGGEETKFSPSGQNAGDMEVNPHGFVHTKVGGTSKENNNTKGQMGLMAVVPVAALDPVFFLHHCNIDRMWTAWNNAGNSNPSDQNWQKGPASQGDRAFVMPLDANATPWYYTPSDVNTTNVNYQGSIYSYIYDDLSLTSYDNTPPATTQEKLTARLNLLGKFDSVKSITMTNRISELIGASENATPINLESGVTQATVKLNAPAMKTVSKSLIAATESKLPDEVFLQLEGITGGHDANSLSVYVNHRFVKTVPLFGLLTASIKDAHHGDSGLSFKFSITNIIDELHLSHNSDINQINVQIKTDDLIPPGYEIKIKRISIYRAGQ